MLCGLAPTLWFPILPLTKGYTPRKKWNQLKSGPEALGHGYVPSQDEDSHQSGGRLSSLKTPAPSTWLLIPPTIGWQLVWSIGEALAGTWLWLSPHQLQPCLPPLWWLPAVTTGR